ncbi:helix-turn-helix domain-containing protein [Streptomyces sp. NPDC055681]
MAVELDVEVRVSLERLASSAKAQVRAVARARIVLAAADGLSNGQIARQLQCSVHTVRKWRGRFSLAGPAGLRDAARPGRPRVHGALARVAVVAAATSTPPDGAATWTHQAIAERFADTVFAVISPSHVGRILADLDLKPHKVTGWLTRRDTPECGIGREFRDRSGTSSQTAAPHGRAPNSRQRLIRAQLTHRSRARISSDSSRSAALGPFHATATL